MYFLFDIGGTKMRFALANEKGEVGEMIMVPTPDNFAAAWQAVREAADRLRAGRPLSAAAGGIAGIMNPERTALLRAPHLPGWVGEPLQTIFSRELNCPVFLENDAALAGLGETLFGAGQGQTAEIVAYLTVSTGVGGARLVRGAIDRHLTSFEPGQQIINWHEPTKHLEDYVSGSAVKLASGQEPRLITDQAFWLDLSRTLAVGLHNTIMHWTPELVILGGSMLREPGVVLEEVEKTLRLSLDGWAQMPSLRRATLGDRAGLLGALAFLPARTS